jgi:hypothetical protein
MPERDISKLLVPQPAQPGADAGLAAISAGFAAGVGRVAGAVTPPGNGQSALEREITAAMCWPLRMPPQVVTAAATIDAVDMGPPEGRAWHVRELPMTLNGASSWSIYWEAVQPQNLILTQAASGLWEPAQLIMLPGERLVFSFTGGGGIVGRPIGVQMDVAFLPTYLA